MPIEGERLTKGKEFLSCRDVLWYLSFFGFGIGAMLEINLCIAIIAMVIPRSKAVIVSQCTYDAHMSSNLSDLWVNGSSVTNFEKHNVTHTSVSFLELTSRPEVTTPLNPMRYPDRFAWNEYEQGLVLGGMFWLQCVTQLPGGVLARRYGTKLIFGLSNLVTALLGFLLPICARYNFYAFLAIRILQGLFVGLTWPSMHDMVAKWIPPIERSKFISSYFGNSIGGAITLPLCAMLINLFGWDSVFYVTSALGVIWYIAWYYLAYDTPQEHPRISEAEKSYILENLEDSVNHVSSKTVPWKAILTSVPIWITAVNYCGASWGVYTLVIDGPTYFNVVHGWDLTSTSLLSSIPYVMRMLFSYVFSSFGDWLLRTKRISITNLRKFAILVCNGIQSMMLLVLAFSGCHPNLAIVVMIIGMAASGALTTGTLASCIDLSPNYAAINLGICNIVTTLAGFISPLIVGILTNNNQTIEQWRLVFLINVAIIFGTGVLYVFFGTSKLQPWNDSGSGVTDEELEKLRSNVCVVDKNTDVISKRENGDKLP